MLLFFYDNWSFQVLPAFKAFRATSRYCQITFKDRHEENS